MVSGNSATVTAAAGNSLGFFIVSNGYTVNNSYSSLNLTTGHLEFRNSDGSTATTASTAPQLYYVNASGAATALSITPRPAAKARRWRSTPTARTTPRKC
jgi:hypothetical protein